MKFSALKRFSFTRKSEDLARAFARCFHSEDGMMVLEHLHHLVLFRMTEPNISEEQLRFYEGQRQFVLYMCQLAAKK